MLSLSLVTRGSFTPISKLGNSGATADYLPSGNVLQKKLPSEPTSALFVQSFTSSFPVVLDPVVLLRLLVHRLLTTTTHLQRWKSCASRSSFASVTHEVPRSPRSRASSTDTDASTLRKRRKVSPDVFSLPKWNFLCNGEKYVQIVKKQRKVLIQDCSPQKKNANFMVFSVVVD